MSTSQSAILPEAGPFALYSLLKIHQHPQKVLHALQALPNQVEQLNTRYVDANLHLSIAFTKQCWQHFDAPTPDELIEFPEFGEGDVFAPSSDVDVLIHCHSHRADLHFHLLDTLMNDIKTCVSIVDETPAFRYLDARDMTGFVDGTENPKQQQRQQVAIIPEGPFSGGSYVMLQRFVHQLDGWKVLPTEEQEIIIGRTKADSIELDDVASASHVGRVDLKEQGKGLKIVRHSLPYGTVSGAHGLLFIAYCNTVHNFQAMLESMYGSRDGTKDQLLNYTKAVTGGYFFAPCQKMLADLQVI
ncbi:Dyp-type peroxidase [Vibrio profundum]|uniref:Dyp-type peroxidase n=1 Tax=Vibrio profundum TaxID=2910247 RepID=UPI003D107DEA